MGICSAISVQRSKFQRYVRNFYNAIGLKNPNLHDIANTEVQKQVYFHQEQLLPDLQEIQEEQEYDFMKPIGSRPKKVEAVKEKPKQKIKEPTEIGYQISVPGVSSYFSLRIKFCKQSNENFKSFTQFYKFMHDFGQRVYHSDKQITDADFSKNPLAQTIRFQFKTTNINFRANPRLYRGTAKISLQKQKRKWYWDYIDITEIFIPSLQPIYYNVKSPQQIQRQNKEQWARQQEEEKKRQQAQHLEHVAGYYYMTRHLRP